jgi:hypothetical protein
VTVEHGTATPPVGAASTEPSKPEQVVSRVGDEAGNIAGTAAEGVREVADEVRTQAREVTGQAREQLDEFVGQARDEVRQQVQQRSEQAAGQLRTLSDQLVALAEGRPESAGSLAGLLYDAEDRVRGLATRLEQRGPEGVKDDLSNFARRRPGVFLAAAVGLGFVVGRAVRAGSSAQQSASASAPSATPLEPAATPFTAGRTAVEDEPLMPVGDGPTAAASGIPR